MLTLQGKVDSMPLTPEQLYDQLRTLVQQMPDLTAPGPLSTEIHQWLARAAVLVEMVDILDAVKVKAAPKYLGSSVLRDSTAEEVVATVHYALAKAEMNAPVAVRGAFIAAGSTL